MVTSSNYLDSTVKRTKRFKLQINTALETEPMF